MVLYNIIIENILKFTPEGIKYILNSNEIIINETNLLKSLLYYIRENGCKKEITNIISTIKFDKIDLIELSKEEDEILFNLNEENDFNIYIKRINIPLIKGINNKLKEIIYKYYVKDKIEIDENEIKILKNLEIRNDLNRILKEEEDVKIIIIIILVSIYTKIDIYI